MSTQGLHHVAMPPYHRHAFGAAWADRERWRIVAPFGGALAFDIEDRAARLPAVGPSYSDSFTVTAVGTSTFGGVALGSGVGIRARATTDATSGDGINAQSCAAFTLGEWSVMFRARVKVTTPATTDLFVGLAERSTDVLGGVTDAIGFRQLSGGNLEFVYTRDGVEQAIAGPAITAGAWVDLAFEADYRGALWAWVDDAVMNGNNSVAYTPGDTVLLAPTIQVATGAAAARAVDVSRFLAIQLGREQ